MNAFSDIPLVRVAGLQLAYGRKTVLSDVSLCVGRGEFWFFIGPNGEGKTSLLRALLGGLRPRAGTIELAPALAGREKVAFVPQQCEMNPTLPTTAREFVLLGLVGLRLSRGEEEKRLEYALDKAGLSGLAACDYWALSGGQRQRALVARALVRRPDLLILDEPFTGLDLPTEDVLLSSLLRLHREQSLSLIFVTHDLALAARLGTHVALFSGGRVLCGTPGQLLHPEPLGHAFGADFSALLHEPAWRPSA